MDNTDRLNDLKREHAELRVKIEAWGKRLADGENAVRQQLNPAIRRADELLTQIVAIERAAGITDAFTQLMYGPPWRFGKDNERKR